VRRAGVLLTLLGPLLLLAACNGEDNEAMQSRPIEEVMDQHVDDLMAVPGVVGVGIGDCGGNPCIKVFVVERTPALEARIPDRLDGYEVAIEETGQIRPRLP
jgi:hypothetical protein